MSSETGFNVRMVSLIQEIFKISSQIRGLMLMWQSDLEQVQHSLISVIVKKNTAYIESNQH